MSTLGLEDEGFEPTPAESEPPEGDRELALQEEAVGTASVAPAVPPPPVVGRTWALNFETGRLGEPIRDLTARRQAIEKAMRTVRGGSEVHDDDYGLDNADSLVEGQPFDSAAWAELEANIREALISSLPWVLEVTNFDATGSDTSSIVEVTFRVIPEGDDQPIDFDRYPLPIT